MIRFGLVGCGRIAQRHAKVLSGDKVAGARLGAVCDIMPDKAYELASKFDVPAFMDMHEMMNREELDVAVVLTESGLHARHVMELAQYKKPIIVEKPMALSLDDADRMIEATLANAIPLFVVKQNRYNVPIIRVRQALESGRFGRLVLGSVRVRWCRTQDYYDQAPWRGTWRLDGGVLSNQASHHIDLLQWMMGEPESVFAMGRTALADIEAEDTAVVTVRFRNGALGVVEATTATRPSDLEGSLSLLGERGSAVVGGFALNEMHTWQFETPFAEDDEVLANASTNPPDVYGYGHAAFYDHVLRTLTAGAPPPVDGIEGRRSLELITAVYESMETGREVDLRFRPKKCRLGVP